MLSHVFPLSIGLNITKHVFQMIYTYVHSLSRKLLQNAQFENLTFLQTSFREISRLFRTTPFLAMGFEESRVPHSAMYLSVIGDCCIDFLIMVYEILWFLTVTWVCLRKVTVVFPNHVF